MSLWGQMLISEQSKLAWIFNRDFHDVGYYIDHPLGGEPMTDLRCTCGAWDKIEEALERIKNGKNGIYKIIYDFNPDAKWEMLEALEHPNICHQVRLDKFCDLGPAIIELADKVDPPKPKEREWRVGDKVQSPNGSVGVVYGLMDIVGQDQGAEVQLIESEIKYGLTPDGAKPEWRNLTIEGEK